MFRLRSHLLIVALATIGILMAPTPAESQVSKLHVTAAVSGEVGFLGQACTVTSWENPLTHTPDPNFPDAPGTKVAFSGLVLAGAFVGTTHSFVGRVVALTQILACAATIAELPDPTDPGEQLLTYGLILPGSFSSPLAGALALDAGASCVYGSVGTGLFLTVGVIAVALIPINYKIEPAGPVTAVGTACPVSADHRGPHTVSALVEVEVIPCGSVPDPVTCGVETDDQVVGMVTLLPTEA